MEKTNWLGSKGEGYVVIQFILFALVGFGPKQLSGMAEWSAQMVSIGEVIGVILAVLGMTLAVSGVMSLGGNLTAVPRPKQDANLVQKGAYRLVRHPIYSGIIFAAFGWAFLKAGTLIFLYSLILLIFFDIKSRQEEQWLKEKYPDYETYAERVKKLIPFIY